MSFFAYPLALCLLLLLPWLGLLAWWARRRKHKALARFGDMLGFQRGQVPQTSYTWLRRFAMLLGLALFIVGIAGPQWGHDSSLQTIRGRDIVLLLDLSRSMHAEPKSRKERALAALENLCDTVEKRGGHRLALIVFAAHPEVVCPLTSDYDHVRFVLKQLAEKTLLPKIYPNSKSDISGTRIGAALAEAVKLHDVNLEGAQDILLLSDGDDPAGDQEWRQGITEAQRGHIPVDVVGVGDPDTPSLIPTEIGPLEFEEKLVKTKLEEGPLQEIASQTKGTYIPMRTKALPLGKLYHEILANRDKQRDNEDYTLVVPRQCYAWFLGPALALLIVTILIGEGKRKPGVRSQESGVRSS